MLRLPPARGDGGGQDVRRPHTTYPLPPRPLPAAATTRRHPPPRPTSAPPARPPPQVAPARRHVTGAVGGPADSCRGSGSGTLFRLHQLPPPLPPPAAALSAGARPPPPIPQPCSSLHPRPGGPPPPPLPLPPPRVVPLPPSAARRPSGCPSPCRHCISSCYCRQRRCRPPQWPKCGPRCPHPPPPPRLSCQLSPHGGSQNSTSHLSLAIRMVFAGGSSPLRLAST